MRVQRCRLLMAGGLEGGGEGRGDEEASPAPASHRELSDILRIPAPELTVLEGMAVPRARGRSWRCSCLGDDLGAEGASAAASAARSLEVGVVGTQPLACSQYPGLQGSPHTHLDYLPPGPGLAHLLASAASLVLGTQLSLRPSLLRPQGPCYESPGSHLPAHGSASSKPPDAAAPAAPHLPGTHPHPSLLSTAPAQGLPWLGLIWCWR